MFNSIDVFPWNMFSCVFSVPRSLNLEYVGIILRVLFSHEQHLQCTDNE